MLFLSFCLPCTRWSPLSRDQSSTEGLSTTCQHHRNPQNIQQSERFRWPITGARSLNDSFNTGHYFVLCCGREAGVCWWCDKTWGDSLCFIRPPAGHSISVWSRCFNLARSSFLSISHCPMGFHSLIHLFNIIPSIYQLLSISGPLTWLG